MRNAANINFDTMGDPIVHIYPMTQRQESTGAVELRKGRVEVSLSIIPFN